MGRYDLPDPKCRHVAHEVRVFAGDPEGAYASTWVCARIECIEDAKEWAEAQVRQPAQTVPRAALASLSTEKEPSDG